MAKPKKHIAPKRREKIPESIRSFAWVQGQSGNPKGKPPGIKSLTKIYRQQLDEPAWCVPLIAKRADELGLNPEFTTIGSVLALAQIYEAVVGRANAAKDIADRVDAAANRSLNKHQITNLAEAIADVLNQEVNDPQVRAVIAERIAGLVGTIRYDDDDV